ncbi:MAG: EamA family transporter [Turneriella sp.]
MGLLRVPRSTGQNGLAKEVVKRITAPVGSGFWRVLNALTAVLLWSSLATLASRLSHLPPFFLTGAALVIGSLIMAPGYRSWRVRFKTFAVGTGALFFYHAALFVAFQRAPVVSANLVNYLWPLLIVVLAPLIQPGQRLSARIVLAALLGFAGAALAIIGEQKLHFAPREIMGYAFALCAALIWSSYSLVLRRLPSFADAAVGGFNLAAGCFSLMVSALFETTPSLQTQDLLYLTIIGAGPLGLAFLFWHRAAVTLPPRKLGVLSFLTPVLSTTALVFSTGKIPGWQLALGAVLVVGAIGLALQNRTASE